MLSAGALWDFQQGILCLQMRERSLPALFYRPDGINAPNVLAVTLLFRLVRKSKPYLWRSFSSFPLGRRAIGTPPSDESCKPTNLYSCSLHLNSQLLSLCGDFKALCLKIFTCGLTKKATIWFTSGGGVGGIISGEQSVALAITETPSAAERGARDTEQGNN